MATFARRSAAAGPGLRRRRLGGQARGGGIPRASADRVIDDQLAGDAIDKAAGGAGGRGAAARPGARLRLRLSDHPRPGGPLGGRPWRPRLSARARLGGHGPQIAACRACADLSLYRPNVGVVLFHKDGRVWYGRRAGAAPPHNWQFPQGGVDDGEDLLDAARRELREETGVRSSGCWAAPRSGWPTTSRPTPRPNEQGLEGAKADLVRPSLRRPRERDRPGQRRLCRIRRLALGNLLEAPDLVVPFKRNAYEHVVRAFIKFS